MTDWVTARATMLEAFEPIMGAEILSAFDELLPKRPWREAIAAQHWYRPEVLDAVGECSPRRYQLHNKLIEVIGEAPAGVLMEFLPPAPWAELERLGVPVRDLLVA